MGNVVGWGMALGGALLSLTFGVMAPAVGIDAGEGVETHDISQLADGETMTFGEGDAQITVRREGDRLFVTLPGDPGGEPKTLVWKADGGSHYAYAVGEGGAHAVVLDRRSEGGDERNVEVVHVQSGEGKGLKGRVALLLESLGIGSAVDCGPGGDGGVVIVKRVSGEGVEDEDVQVVSGDCAKLAVEKLEGGEGAAKVLVRIDGDGRSLRCPEGDTTMTVEKDDDRTYYCPQHDVALEEVETRKRLVRTVVVKEAKPDDRE